MQIYRHALLLVQNETDGLLLLEQAERLAKDGHPYYCRASQC
jgi:hypothetical protein